MKKETVSTVWQEEMSFQSQVDNHTISLDAEDVFGGRNRGSRPKPLMLTALGGCTAMDVVSLLNKMRVPFTGLTVDVSAELTEEHPKVYQNVMVTYKVKGTGLDPEKVEKAVALSQEKYCGVIAMFKSFSTVSYTIEYINRINQVKML